MTYRDDIAALRARVDRLQAQLDELDPAGWQTVEQRLRASLQPRWPGSVKAAFAITAITLIAGGAYLNDEVTHARRDASMASSQAANASQLAQQTHQAVASIRIPVAPQFDPVVRPGTVSEVTGASPVERGAGCVVTVIPAAAGGGLNCQVRVQCDGQRIYGKPGVGYAVCGIEHNRPTVARDDDPTPKSRGGQPVAAGDPKLELDLPQNRVVVADTGPDFRIVIDLPAPSDER